MTDIQPPEWMLEFARCEPWIAAALEYAGGTHTVEDVMLRVATGDAQLWPGQSSAVVTEILTYPQMRVLNFWLAGGDMSELEAMREPIERWAKSQGCKRVTLSGRRGWSRSFLAKAGYAPQWYVMAKDLQ